ncbi:hypothetical protein [Bailinhaonella thermotolerans]|nr:hypothetical protein [Bailinhaonella thermotolerans]
MRWAPPRGAPPRAVKAGVAEAILVVVLAYGSRPGAVAAVPAPA